MGAFILASVMLLANLGCSPGHTDGGGAYPRKPIKVVVPFPAGGGSDSFARLMQRTVRDEALLPQPMVIINVPGAGGTVGSRRVRDVAPDGYTILCLHEGIFSSKYAGKVSYGPEAFQPIAATGQSNLVVCVRDDAPFGSLSELMARAIEQPGQIRFGMAPGTPTHFTGRRLEKAAGDESEVRFRYVASGGGAKRFHDLIGGHIDVTPFSLAEFANFQASGVRAIAYLAPERLAEIPDIPTAREQGYDVVMTHVQYWWAPKGTPDAAVQRIGEVLETAMATDDMVRQLEDLKIQPTVLRGERLANHLALRKRDFEGVALVRFEGLPDPVPLVAVFVMSLGCVVGFQTFSRARADDPDSGLPRETRKALTIGAVGLSVYVLGMQVLQMPFGVATALFIPLMGFGAGARSRSSLLRLVVIGIGMGWVCTLIFTKVLVIDLP